MLPSRRMLYPSGGRRLPGPCSLEPQGCIGGGREALDYPETGRKALGSPFGGSVRVSSHGAFPKLPDAVLSPPHSPARPERLPSTAPTGLSRNRTSTVRR